jgi:hypothetical protein
MSVMEQPNGQAVSPGRQPAPESTAGSPQRKPPEESQQAAEESVSPILKQAYYLRKEAAAGYLNATLGPFFEGHLHPMAFNQYVSDVLEKGGSPKDPIERMLMEQLILAHHNIGRLQVQAAGSKGTAEAEMYNTAAVRLMGEFRKTALALKTYRMPGTSLTAPVKPVAPSTSQAQVAPSSIPEPGRAKRRTSLYDPLIGANGNGKPVDAATGRPQVAPGGMPEPGPAKPRTSLYDPLIGAKSDDQHPAVDPFSESQKGRSRKEELAEAAGAYS